MTPPQIGKNVTMDVIKRSTVDEAVSLGLEELDRMLTLLRSLDEADWDRPTDCEGWDVHDIVAHVVGQYEGAARPDRLLRRVRAARRMPGYGVLDGHNELQVRERRDLTPAELIEELEAWGRRGIPALGRIPAPLRRMRLSRIFPEAVGQPDDSLDFLIRAISPRDPWMHRIDVSAATGRAFVPDEHDRRIVEQVVADLLQIWHGPAVRLVLEGLAGGDWIIGQNASRRNETGRNETGQSETGQSETGQRETGQRETGQSETGQSDPVAEVRCDAIAYCRRVSGRPTAPAQPAEVNGDRVAGEALLGTKIIF